MLTPLNFTSRSQGQLFGAKPKLEEIEKELQNDPMTNAAAQLIAFSVAIVAFGKSVVHVEPSEIRTPAWHR
jgi:hypothetical protein